MSAYIKAVQQLYQPSVGSMVTHLPTMGQSLDAACCALADDCTVERVDELVARLKTAEQSLTRLRLALVREAGV